MSNQVYVEPIVEPAGTVVTLDADGMIDKIWAGDSLVLPTYIHVPAVKVTMTADEWSKMSGVYEMWQESVLSSEEVRIAWDLFVALAIKNRKTDA